MTTLETTQDDRTIRYQVTRLIDKEAEEEWRDRVGRYESWLYGRYNPSSYYFKKPEPPKPELHMKVLPHPRGTWRILPAGHSVTLLYTCPWDCWRELALRGTVVSSDEQSLCFSADRSPVEDQERTARIRWFERPMRDLRWLFTLTQATQLGSGGVASSPSGGYKPLTPKWQELLTLPKGFDIDDYDYPSELPFYEELLREYPQYADYVPTPRPR